MKATRVWKTDATIYALTALIAIVFGAFAALASSAWLGFVSIVALIALLAFVLPRSFIAPALVGFAVLQFYLTIPGTAATLRGALVFVACVALRALATQPIEWRANRTWLLAACAFVFAALVAAYGAPNRYAALKGVYDWGAVFLTILVASAIITTPPTRVRMLIALLAMGTLEAILGLAQAALGVERVRAILSLPGSELFFQPNLLRERIAAMSFNWIVFDRVLPFGNFINGIDYAVFLAAMIALALAWLFAERTRRQMIALLASVSAMGVALLLTFKGSGVLALIGGACVIVIAYAQRLSRRVVMLGLALGVIALALAAPLADALAQRALFLIQRESGSVFTTGRLAIWVELLDVWTRHPWFGVGLNNAEGFIEPLSSLNGGAFTLVVPSPESAYVAALVETGAVGLLALGAMFALTLTRAWQRWRASRDALDLGMLAAIVAWLVGNVTVAGFTTDQNGMVLGLMVGMFWARQDARVGN
ncbi:MAG: O-antigen ligase family protein [Chloroflexi bacterium]|nr:O-antigen ligase family protein [Chloroflexota bacterium]